MGRLTPIIPKTVKELTLLNSCNSYREWLPLNLKEKPRTFKKYICSGGGEGATIKSGHKPMGKRGNSNFMYTRSAKKNCLVLVRLPVLIEEQETTLFITKHKIYQTGILLNSYKLNYCTAVAP